MLLAAYPDSQDDGLGLSPVHAESPDNRAGRPRLRAVETDEMRADNPALGFPDGVAGVVPTVGNPVAVGIFLQVIHGRRPGPLDLGLLILGPATAPATNQNGASARTAASNCTTSFSFARAPGTGRVTTPLSPRTGFIRLRPPPASGLGSGPSLRAFPVIGTKRVGLSSLSMQLAVFLDDQVNRLVEPGPQRNDHPAPFLELVDQRPGDSLRGAGDDDRVERGRLGPTLVAVADPGVDVRVAQLLVHGGGRLPRARA